VVLSFLISSCKPTPANKNPDENANKQNGEINKLTNDGKPLDLAQSYLKNNIKQSLNDVSIFKNSTQINKWQLPNDYKNRYPVSLPMIPKGNMIYYLTNQREISEGYNVLHPDKKYYNPVVAFDTLTKQNRWIYKIEYPLFSSLAISDRSAFMGTNISDKAIGRDKNYLVALDIVTGKEKWTFHLKDHLPQEILQANGELMSISIKGGIQYWNQQVLCIVEANKYIRGGDDYYFNYLLSLNENDGSINWYHIFPTGEDFSYCSTFLIDHDKLYIANGDPHSPDYLLYSLDLPKHQFKKKTEIMIKDILITPSTTFFLSNNKPYLVGAIDLESGKIPWSIGLKTLPKDIDIDYSHMYIFENWLVLSSDYKLTGVDLNEPDNLWTIWMEDLEPYMFHAFVQDDSILYFGIGPQDWNQGETYVVAFDITTRQFLWKWKIPYNPNIAPGVITGSLYISTAPTLMNGSLYFISSHGEMYEMLVK
jgi:outer membrane protein assembly factor BamB